MIEAAEANATHPQDTSTVSAKPRLLDQMRQVIRVKHYSMRTEYQKTALHRMGIPFEQAIKSKAVRLVLWDAPGEKRR